MNEQHKKEYFLCENSASKTDPFIASMVRTKLWFLGREFLKTFSGRYAIAVRNRRFNVSRDTVISSLDFGRVNFLDGGVLKASSRNDFVKTFEM